MNKQEVLSLITALIDCHCDKLKDRACKPLAVIESYRAEHEQLLALVCRSKCHTRNKLVMLDWLRRTSALNLADRCYRKDANALYNAFYRFKVNLPHVA